MSEAWIDIDAVPERELPAHANDGKSGDRVSFLDGGLLHVVDGRATFVRWTDVLGVIARHGGVIVLVPRRPPAQPWIRIEAELLGGGPDAAATFVKRLEERGSGGGYRDAVRKRRQNLSLTEVRDRVAAREPVPGALEVPSTLMLGVSYPWLGAVQFLVFCGFIGLAYVLSIGVMVGVMVASGPGARANEGAAPLLMYPILFGVIVLGAWVTIKVGKVWRERKNRTLPRQRVLVLAPDGCIIGFRTGVRVLAWPQIGQFRAAPSPATYEDALVVLDPDGKMLGDIEASWLDAPLPLVVSVAETYREAALG